MNPDPSWNQRWRGPLRGALNELRDELAAFYERKMGALCTDPWAARDAYVDVVLDGGRADDFVAAHAPRALAHDERVRFFQLLELQRCTLLMFTSCGWFFDDVDGGEAVILMKYAARALGLAEKLGHAASGVDVKERFLAHLEQAEANQRRADGSRVNGREVFVERAESAALDHERVAVSVALAAATGDDAVDRVAAFSVVGHEEHAVDDAAVPCVAGRVDLDDDRTGEAKSFAFVVVGFGGVDWRGVLCGADQLPRLHAKLEAEPETSALTRLLDDEIEAGGRPFSLKDAPADVRDAVAAAALARRVDVVDGILAELLLAERALLRGVVGLGGALSPSLKALTAHALSRRAKDVVDELLASTGSGASYVRRLRTVLDDAAELGVVVDTVEAARKLELALAFALRRFLDGQDASSSSRASADAADVVRLLDVMSLLGGDRPLPALLPLVARCAARAFSDKAFATSTEKLLPALERAVRSRFAPEPTRS